MAVSHHPGSGGRHNDVVYHVAVDNSDKKPHDGIAVQLNLPAGANIVEAYYYKATTTKNAS